MVGDPWPSPISPSRLRPWKAPNKDLSFDGAGFLAVVVCWVWDMIRLHLSIEKQKVFVVAMYLGPTHSGEAMVAPEVSSSHRPLGVLLGQDGLLPFPVEKSRRST